MRRPAAAAVHTTPVRRRRRIAYGKRAAAAGRAVARRHGGDAVSASSPCASRLPRRRRGDVQPLGGIEAAAARPRGGWRRRVISPPRSPLPSTALWCRPPPLLLRPQLGRDACLPRARRRCDAAAIRVPDRPPARAPPGIARISRGALLATSATPPHRARLGAVAFARSGAHVDDTLWLPADVTTRRAYGAPPAPTQLRSSRSTQRPSMARCAALPPPSGGSGFAAEAPRLLRFPRLFCVAESAAAGVVHGAPCCTRFSMATG